jgi:hypothetical protein
MATTPTTPSLPPLKPLRFTFPFRKKGNGTASVEITDEHEFHRILKNEPSGTYSLSSKECGTVASTFRKLAPAKPLT